MIANKYTILSKIGSGQFSNVFKGKFTLFWCVFLVSRLRFKALFKACFKGKLILIDFRAVRDSKERKESKVRR